MTSRNAGTPSGPQAANRRAPPLAQVSCDECGWPMPVPEHCIQQGQILGLLTCSLCTEDHLEAMRYERSCH